MKADIQLYYVPPAARVPDVSIFNARRRDRPISENLKAASSLDGYKLKDRDSFITVASTVAQNIRCLEGARGHCCTALGARRPRGKWVIFPRSANGLGDGQCNTVL
jgi:hypothetical protein